MTADDLLTRLRGRLHEAARKSIVNNYALNPDAAADALRPECEAIARETAELREKDVRILRVNLNSVIANEQSMRQQADADRVALRQALQRLVDTSQRWEGIRSTPSSRQAFRDARKAAETLLAHEPPETT